MSPQALFGVSVLLSFVAWGLVLWQYVWPELNRQSRDDAARPILLLHCFRFVGLAFLLPGVVSSDLASAWALPAAYGDLGAALLALLALACLRTTFGVALVWIFNVWGSADLLFAFYRANQVGLEPGQLGAGYFIVTVLVPLLLHTHALLFRILWRGDAVTVTR
jgi:hypothetical protein